MGSILVIGNGFDLYHYKKTRYSDFLKFLDDLISRRISNSDILFEIGKVYESSSVEFGKSSLETYLLNAYSDNKKKNNWINMELDIKKYIHRLLSFLELEGIHEYEGINNFARSFNINSLTLEHQLIVKSSVSLFGCVNPRFYQLFNIYLDSWGFANIEKVISRLELELTCLSKVLNLYLRDYEPGIRDFQPSPQHFIVDIKPSMVISFNYTNTLQELYSIPDEIINYIHGNLNDDNIVLGYDDFDESYNDLVFKKYYRRLINRADALDERDIYYNHDGFSERQDVYFFGHSLDYSDEDYLRMIISNSRTVTVFYLDEMDRSQKIANLIRLLGKKETINSIRNRFIVFRIIPEYEVRDL